VDKEKEEVREPSALSATEAFIDTAFHSISVPSNMTVEGGYVAFFKKYFLCLKYCGMEE
jgi:hypothetical protein